ncbi:MAG: ArsR/SmtB family transcription factor, partial [Methyloligellaceae bacterium]
MPDQIQTSEPVTDLKSTALEKMKTGELLSGLKAAGEATRLRLLALLASGELNVKDLTRIMGQSQPRISRHLKLLTDAGLIERFREGSWVYFRLAARGSPAALARAIVNSLDPADPDLELDRMRADTVLRERAEAAQAYFKANAGDWDVIRSLHLAEEQVEAAILDALGAGPFEYLVDLGTGTGRMLELFATRAGRAIGVDVNRDMLAYARAKLDASQIDHCQVRQGDLF